MAAIGLQMSLEKYEIHICLCELWPGHALGQIHTWAHPQEGAGLLSRPVLSRSED